MSNHNRVGRRVYVTVCECVLFDDDNEMKTETIELYGNINDKEHATSKVAKKLGTNRVIVKKMETSSKYYSMPLETFIENADSVMN